MKYLWFCFAYRPLMRLVHRYGWHHMEEVNPVGGPPMAWCHWCGLKADIPQPPPWKDQVHA
jgi:hypothetical protein